MSVCSCYHPLATVGQRAAACQTPVCPEHPTKSPLVLPAKVGWATTHGIVLCLPLSYLPDLLFKKNIIMKNMF